jgi:hypothetical protein
LFNSFPYLLLCSLPAQMNFSIVDCVILFSFPSSPEFHRVIPILITCLTHKFVYDHDWFCVYVYLWIYLPHMREHVAFVLLNLAYFT